MSQVAAFIPAPFVDKPRDLAELSRELSKRVGQPVVRCSVSAADQAAGARVFTVKVVNQAGDGVTGLFLVLVWVSPTVGGQPGGVQACAFVTGSVVETLAVNAMWRVISESNGTLSFSVAAAAGQGRAVHAIVLGVADSSELKAFV